MKPFFSLFALVIIALLAYDFVFTDKTAPVIVQGLPWQISVQADGSTEVFGLKPGKSTLADAVSVLGNDAKLAIIASRNEVGTLEMYYGHYRASLITGKIILQAKIANKQLEKWKREAVKVNYMPSGKAREYLLDSDQLPEILHSTIESITFIPAINLDEDILNARFGKASKIIRVNKKLVHYLYPTKGLDIVLSEEKKDVLQYVNPADFQKLEQPLQQK